MVKLAFEFAIKRIKLKEFNRIVCDITKKILFLELFISLKWFYSCYSRVSLLAMFFPIFWFWFYFFPTSLRMQNTKMFAFFLNLHNKFLVILYLRGGLFVNKWLLPLKCFGIVTHVCAKISVKFYALAL